VNIAELTIGSDWTRHGVKSLSLWFYGDPSNSAEQMYVKLNGVKVAYDSDASNISKPVWQPWNINLADFAGVDLSDVTELIIGFERGAGGSGMVLFDDILLYRSAPSSEEIWLEAEAADSITEPMKIYDDPLASGGKYIGTDEGIGNSSSNPPPDSIATYSFAAQEGTYKILFRVIADAGTGSNSFWVRILGATSPQITRNDGWVNTNPMDSGDTWHWDEIHNDDQNDNVVHFTLPAGQHTLEIARREDGTLLDAILITNQLE